MVDERDGLQRERAALSERTAGLELRLGELLQQKQGLESDHAALRGRLEDRSFAGVERRRRYLRKALARVKALLRRAEGRVGPGTPSHGFRVDDDALRIAWQDQWLPLTPLEFRLLKKLLSRPGHVFSRNALLESVHEDFRDTTDRAIDSHIKNLRKKIGKVRPAGSAIVSVYGMGYRFDPDAEDAPA